MTIPLNQWKVRNAHRNPNPDEMQNWHCHPNCNNKPIQSQIQGSLNPRKDRIIEIENSITYQHYQLPAYSICFAPFCPPPLQLLKQTTKNYIYPVIWRVSRKSLWSLCTSIPINQVNHTPKTPHDPRHLLLRYHPSLVCPPPAKGSGVRNLGTRDQWLHVCKWYQLADIAIEVNCK